MPIVDGASSFLLELAAHATVDNSIITSSGTTTTQPHSPYHYIPTKSVGIIFVVLFSISTSIHAGQSIYYRAYWLLPTVCLSGFMEILGWAGRLWSSMNVTNRTPFMIQIIMTIIAPTPLVAANFIILGKMIGILGSPFSRLSPKWYSIIFCSCDIISLVVQGAGGGLASTATGPKGGDPEVGGHIMLGGIIFQMITISVYVILAAEFFWRYYKNRPIKPMAITDSYGKPVAQRGGMGKRMKLMIFGLSFNTLCLYIRAIYRTIELSDGWSGRIISTQVYFNVLDGAMIVLAIYTINIMHPGHLLPSPEDQAATEYNGKKGGSSGSLA